MLSGNPNRPQEFGSSHVQVLVLLEKKRAVSEALGSAAPLCRGCSCVCVFFLLVVCTPLSMVNARVIKTIGFVMNFYSDGGEGYPWSFERVYLPKPAIYIPTPTVLNVVFGGALDYQNLFFLPIFYY